MLQVRFTLVSLILWLGLLYNIERLYEPINLASFVYVFCAVLSVLIIFTPKVRTLTLLEITLISLPVYGFFKWYFGYPFGGDNLRITITECVVLGLTNYLAWKVSTGLDEFVQTASEAATLVLPKQPMALQDGESELYEEVQRARRFKRRLSLATVTFRGEFSSEKMDLLVERAKNEVVRKYLESCVAKQLLASTGSGDLVAYQEGQFVVMFPETSSDEVMLWMRSVEEELYAELGIQLRVGIASFPDQECTLTGLIAQAESEMALFSMDDADESDSSIQAGGGVSPVDCF